MNKFFNLQKKTILLTGANGFIGNSILKCLIKEGCNLILILRDNKSLKKIKPLVRKQNIHIFFADLNNEEELDKALNEIVNKFTSIDGIINLASDNSGLGNVKFKKNFGKFTKAFNNNLIAPIKIVITLRQLLQKNKTSNNHASVINVSSIYGSLSPDQSIYKKDKFINPIDYGCSKAAQIHMSKYLANDKDFKKIRFNNVILGPIPNLNRNFSTQIYKDKLLKKIPLRRFGKPDDIIGVILLLLSSRSSFITGSSITVDGGLSSN